MSHPELTIRGVLLPIRLGCSADERLNPQPVEIDLTIRFETPPRDFSADTVTPRIGLGDAAEDWWFYTFVGIDGYLVVRNMFLDGNWTRTG